MNLATMQRTIATAIMMPLDGRRRVRRNASSTAAASLISPTNLMSARGRLNVYCRSYWFRILESLRDDFPALAAILGQARFERLATRYLAESPSASYTLRDLGSRLEAWMRDHPNYAGSRHELALDMVRLEWAHIVAFDAPSAPALSAEAIGNPPAQLRFGLQPHLTLLDLQYRVDELRLRVANFPKQRGKAIPRTSTQRSNVFLAVHRVGIIVYYRRLHPDEYRLLCALRKGQTLAHAISATLKTSPADNGPALLESWFATWARLGWLTSRKGPA